VENFDEIRRFFLMKNVELGKADFDESEVLKMQIFVVICSARECRFLQKIRWEV